MPGQATAPNQCADSVCSANTPPDQDSENEGTCAGGPVDNFCAIETFRGCATNADCPAPGDTCSVSKFRECFTLNGTAGDAVSVRGEPAIPTGGASRPGLAALFCVAPTSSGAVNSTVGLPSLGRVTLKKAPTTVSNTVPPGQTVTTDTQSTGATSADTVQSSVQTPTGGTITISEGPATSSAPSGFHFLDQEVHITAPAATSTSPLVIHFILDSTLIPPPPTQVDVFKDGAHVLDCSGNPGEATPSPCVSARTVVAGGDLDITVLSATASDWNLAIPATPLIAGKITIKDDPAVVTKRKITLSVKDPAIASGAPGTGHDPTCAGAGGGGATLQVFSTGGSGQNVTIALPCENWVKLGKSTPKGYKYKDSKLLRGPCKTAQIKNGKVLKATCSGKNPARPLNYDLTTGEGSVGVLFTTGSGLGYCTELPGTGGTLKKDDGTKFSAKGIAAPAVCPTP